MAVNTNTQQVFAEEESKYELEITCDYEYLRIEKLWFRNKKESPN
ncbi:MAG: hypothetical protein ACRD42_04225 [Nitrososphaeraceae archaeon]